MSGIGEIFESLEYGPAPESPDRALAWLDARGRRFGHFVGGEWTRPGDLFEVLRPSDGSVLAHGTRGTPEDVDRAVSAARRALPAWRGEAGEARARHVQALARGIRKHARLFAVLGSLDDGKPIRESRDIDVPLAARHFRQYAGWARLVETEFPAHVPVGVIGLIVPWSFPLLVLARKVAPALAAGNAVVLRPAEHTPLTALLFADVAREVGLPEGVVNVVTGDAGTGEAIVRHPGVDAIAFTGSTEVGRLIRTATAGSGKRLSLEPGGRSAFVVFEDADLDSVVEGVVDRIGSAPGPVPSTGSALLVQEGVAGDLERKLRERMERLRMGDPLDRSVDMGAVVSPVHLERTRALVARGEAEGARVWRPSWAVPAEGWFHPPTLCTECSPASVLVREEVGGPVVVLATFRTPDEAVELANDPRSAAVSVWSERVDLALDVAARIEAGTVGVNRADFFAADFGGRRESLWECVRPVWAEGADPPPAAGEEDADAASPGDAPGDDGRALGDAVEAARGAYGAWAARSAGDRARVLQDLAEKLEARADGLADRLTPVLGDAAAALREVEASVRRLSTWAARADTRDGRVHRSSPRGMTLAVPEPIGVVAVVCPDGMPLLGLVSTVAPVIAMGNTAVVVPSPGASRMAADLHPLLGASELPPGVVNLMAGHRSVLAPLLAAHDGVDGIWYIGTREGAAEVERLSTGNMKRTWTGDGVARDWLDPAQGEGEELLREATRIKIIRVPYGLTASG